MRTQGSDCRYRDDLSAYVDRALDGGHRRALEAHLSSCEGCRKELQGFFSVDALVREHPPEIEASPSFQRGFFAAFEAEIASEAVPRVTGRAAVVEEERGFWSWFAKPILIPMSAAAVAVAVAVVTWPEGDPGSAPVAAVADVPEAVAPKVAAEKVEIRPAVAVGDQPKRALASAEELPKAIQQVVREIDAAKPVESRKLADATLSVPVAER